MISKDDYLYLVDEQLQAMIAMVLELGDALANQALDVPGSNSPYAILTHCLGVMEYWGGHVVAGRPSSRDRASEFRASGSVEHLVDRARAGQRQLQEDLIGSEPNRAVNNSPGDELRGSPMGKTQGGALIHIYEELARHRGHVDLTRDLLLARRG